MGEQEGKPKRQRHHDRVALDGKALERLDAWTTQVMSEAKGVTLSRKDLVNWLVHRHDQNLSREEAKELTSMYFNEVRFLQQTIKDVKNARARGEMINLKALLNQETPARERRKTRSKTRGNNIAAEAMGETSPLAIAVEGNH